MSRFGEEPNPILSMSSYLTFGRYKGQTVADVVDINPEYIIWVEENTDWVFDDEVNNSI